MTVWHSVKVSVTAATLCLGARHACNSTSAGELWLMLDSFVSDVSLVGCDVVLL